MSKGSDFERWVCTQLGLWWTDGKRDDVFWRTSTSGARATVRARRGKQTANQHGDVAAVDPIGSPLTDLLMIEIKRGYSADTVQDVLDRREGSKPGTLAGWFEKAEADSKVAERFGWLLISKRDRREPIAWMPFRVAKRLEADGDGWFYRMIHVCTDSIPDVFGISFSDFLKIDPEAIRMMGEEPDADRPAT